MKKVFKMAMYLMAGALMTTSMVACDDDENVNDQVLSQKEQTFKNIVTPYVDHTVVPTYRGMADNAMKLSDACDKMYAAFKEGNLTTDMVKEAGDYWKKSRKFWEQSEAFLYGAAGDYNIDPHIDSWPLDKNAMDDLLDAIRCGYNWSIDNNAGYGLLGFHALEYMLFELTEDGQTSLPHNTQYKEEELIYTCEVVHDLRNQCVLLETAWSGFENVTPEKQALLEDAELVPSIDYGYSMKNAGQGGSLYKTYQAAVEDLIQGAIDIADEVGNLKVGNPVNGKTEDDKNYIESPYSLNSLTDFQDNIISVKNAYLGSQKGDACLSDYILSKNKELDTRIKNLIEESLSTLAAIPEPFAQSAPVDANAKKAVTLIGTDLADALAECIDLLAK